MCEYGVGDCSRQSLYYMFAKNYLKRNYEIKNCTMV